MVKTLTIVSYRMQSQWCSAILLLLLAAVPSQSTQCGDKIIELQGELIVPINKTSCIFTTGEGTKDLTLVTDGMFLAAGDSLVITSINGKTHTYSPPIDAGFLHIGEGFVQPTLEFKISKPKTFEFRVKYSLGQRLDVNTDINHNFKIINIGNSPSLELKFTKSLQEVVHIEVTPPTLVSAKAPFILGSYLLGTNDSELVTYIDAKDTEIFHLTTTIVDKSCSYMVDPLNAKKEISGPSNFTGAYTCIVLLGYDDKGGADAHFDVDFGNFISLADARDELIIKDSGRRIFIDKSSEANYIKRRLSTAGKDLVIVYRSPNGVKTPNPTGLKLTVVPVAFGGLITREREITPVEDTTISYTLIPSEFACISLRPSSPDLKDSQLTWTVDGVASKFGPNTFLPPIMGSSKEVRITYTGKKGPKLQFSPNGSCCNQVGSNEFNLQGRRVPADYAGAQTDSCLWTIARPGDVTVDFDGTDLFPGGCVEINSLVTNKQLFRKCDDGLGGILPKFVVSQAYVNVTLPNKDTQFSAHLTNALAGLAWYKDSIKSTGYPASYPVVSGRHLYRLNATGKNYLVNLADINLRVGEKLQVNATDVVTYEDYLVSNSITNFTIVRPAEQTDFEFRRGIKITTIPYNSISIFNGNVSTNNSNNSNNSNDSNNSNNSITLTNITNSLIKISSQVPAKAGPRVQYTVSSSKPIAIVAYDGASIASPNSSSIGSPGYFVGNSTSSTVMLSLRSPSKDLAPIPTVTISYSYISCPTDAHLCDNSLRCVPRDLQCQGKYYCIDKSDLLISCNTTGPIPPPPPGSTGLGGFTVFILCVLMLTLGALLSTYGPGIYKTLEDRIRGQGQYNSFTSVE